MIAQGILGIISVAFWLSAFLVGLTINSQPYRDALVAGNFTINALAMTMLTYTVTNTAILCILSGVIGALAYTLLYQQSVDADSGATKPMRSQPDSPGKTVVAGVLRSFVIFLVFISGVYIGASDAFGATTQEQYARVVATTCLLSFFVSFNPDYFSKVLNWFTPPESFK